MKQHLTFSGKTPKEQTDVLFDFIHRCGIKQESVSKIMDWEDARVKQFILVCRALVPNYHGNAESIFEFIASSTLSGQPVPCTDLQCRIDQLDSLARFAVLYADQVLLRNPFEYLGEGNGVTRFLKEEVVSCVAILYYLRALLENGIFGFAMPVHFHSDSSIQSGLMAYRKKILRASTKLTNKYLETTEVRIINNFGKPGLELQGDEDLLGHSGVVLNYLEPPELVAKFYNPEQPYLLNKKETRQIKIFQEVFVRDIINDLARQNIYSTLFGNQYISSRQADFEIISWLNNSDANIRSRVIMEGLSHYLPVIQMVGLKKLIELRSKEGESFRVYRDSLTTALKTVDDPDPQKIRQAFNDLVRPEINKIEWTLQNSRKIARSSLQRNFVVTMGYISIALFGNLVPPDLASLLAAVGGLNFIASTVEKSKDLIGDAPVRDEKFYFLWRVQKQKAREL